MNPTITEIVEQFLKDHGYDGLYQNYGEEGCGCRLENLCPCGNPDNEECRAGYGNGNVIQEDKP